MRAFTIRSSAPRDGRLGSRDMFDHRRSGRSSRHALGGSAAYDERRTCGILRETYLKSRRPVDARRALEPHPACARRPSRSMCRGTEQLIEGTVMYIRGSLGQWLIGVMAGVATLSGCDDPAADGKGNTGWAMYNMGYDGVRSSPLAQITVKNVATLRPVCRVKLGEEGTLQAGPVVVAETLFVTTAHSTAALNATTCQPIWRFVDPPTRLDVNPVNRGVAYLDGRVFRGTPDARLVALSSDSGKVLWNVKVGDPSVGAFTSSAPIAWNGLVYMGLAGSDWGIRGRVMAFDAKTGKEKWRFWTVPMGNERGAETWHIPETAEHGGGAMWTSYTLDPQTNEIFVPTGNPAPDFNPTSRPGDNLFTNSVVVLDATSGALRWWYQVSPNDGFDYDLGAAPVLYRGQGGDARVLLASKDGNIYAVDRRSHQLKFKTPITTISKEAPFPTAAGVHACPGPLGGVEWNGPAFDASTHTFYVGAVDWCGTFSLGAPDYKPGSLYWATNVVAIPNDTARGWLTAVNAENGVVRWKFRAPAPIVAGITHTAGGLIFTGDLHGNFYAFDAATGRVAYETNLGGAIAGGVITYAVAGRQYVVAPAGNISRGTFGVMGSPTLIVMALIGGRQSTTQDSAAVPTLVLADVAAVGNNGVGGKVFQLCAACHGARGEGGAGANLQTSKRDLAGIIAYIKAPTGAMPKLYPTPLSDADVSAVAAYVIKLRH
jgi:alcohol dehydrogenase (cytochrome c)